MHFFKVDKREYQRLPVDVMCTFINDKDRLEYSGTICNLSETGFCFLIPYTESERQAFNEGSNILEFQLYDSFEFAYTTETHIINGKARIIWNKMQSNGFLYGCKVTRNATYTQYVTRKKAAEYLNSPYETASKLNMFNPRHFFYRS